MNKQKMKKIHNRNNNNFYDIKFIFTSNLKNKKRTFSEINKINNLFIFSHEKLINFLNSILITNYDDIRKSVSKKILFASSHNKLTIGYLINENDGWLYDVFFMYINHYFKLNIKKYTNKTNYINCLKTIEKKFEILKNRNKNIEKDNKVYEIKNHLKKIYTDKKLNEIGSNYLLKQIDLYLNIQNMVNIKKTCEVIFKILTYKCIIKKNLYL